MPRDRLLIQIGDTSKKETAAAAIAAAVDRFDGPYVLVNNAGTVIQGDIMQTSDPGKLARGLIQLADSKTPPLRWVAGADAEQAAEQKARTLLEQIEAHRALSISLAHDDA